MELTQAVEDKAIRELLFSEEAEAFSQIDTHLRKRFVQGARARLPGLRPEELADAWQETLRDLLKAVRARELDPDRELSPWLWTIFIRRAFDGRRRQERYEGLLQRIRGKSCATSLEDGLAYMEEEERGHLLQAIRRAVETLPSRQRLVIQIFVDLFPATEDLDVLRAQVSKATGQQETRAAVTRALQEARRKVGSLLKSRRLQMGEPK